MAFLNEAIPEYLDLLVQQLLDAPTEDEFHRLRNEALGEYASLSTPNKRELIRRVSIILPPDALADFGRILNEAPQPGSPRAPARLALEASTFRLLAAFPPFVASLLFGLGPELAERFIALFEAETDEALQQAWRQFNVALAENPDRARATIERDDVRFTLTAFQRIVRHGLPRTSPPCRRATLKARLALARQCLRGRVLGGALGLAAPASTARSRVAEAQGNLSCMRHLEFQGEALRGAAVRSRLGIRQEAPVPAGGPI